MDDRKTNLSHPPETERYDAERVRAFADEGADGELLRAEDIRWLASAMLRIVGAALVIVSSALLVYLAAVLLARVVLWAYLP